MQVSLGLAATPQGRPYSIHPVAQWIVQPHHNGKASIKQQVQPLTEHDSSSRLKRLELLLDL
jgi:hypothetical protein